MYFFDAQCEHILWEMISSNLVDKDALDKCSSLTLSHRSTLVYSASA